MNTWFIFLGPPYKNRNWGTFQVWYHRSGSSQCWRMRLTVRVGTCVLCTALSQGLTMWLKSFSPPPNPPLTGCSEEWRWCASLSFSQVLLSICDMGKTGSSVLNTSHIFKMVLYTNIIWVYLHLTTFFTVFVHSTINHREWSSVKHVVLGCMFPWQLFLGAYFVNNNTLNLKITSASNFYVHWLIIIPLKLCENVKFTFSYCSDEVYLNRVCVILIYVLQQYFNIEFIVELDCFNGTFTSFIC